MCEHGPRISRVSPSYTGVLKVRGTVVQELGIADNARTTTRKTQHVLMHSFY
jgi:hypothetical protein